MKTIKILLLIMITFLMNDTCKSYLITVNNICSSQDNPTPFYFPTGNININYKIDSVNVFDRGDPRCLIYLVQGGTEFLMYNEIVPEGEILSTPLNPENLPGLQYNEPVTIKMIATSTIIPVPIIPKNFYFIIYRDGLHNNFATLSNGVSELINHSGYGTFISSSDCESAATANYSLRQYKVTFTLHGNFTDSIPVIINEYSLGYSGALPNNQNRFAYQINISNTEIRLVTFVYKLENILGQDMGYFPCPPENARVVFKYDKKPVINSIVSFPAIITPSNNIALLVPNITGDYDNTLWTDSNNIHNHVLTPHGDYAVLNANLWQISSGRIEWYSVGLQVFNQQYSSNRFKFRPYFGSDPQGCPAISYNEKGFDLTENHILNRSPSNNNTDVTDYYQTFNPFNKVKDTITFSITEKENDITKIDLLKLYQIEAEENTEAAVTEDGEVVNFENDAFKNVVLLNSGKDVSEELRSVDNNILQINKDTVLNIIVPPGDDNYLVIRGRTKQHKENISCRLLTSLNEESNIYFRELFSEVCIKLDKKKFTDIIITALQDCEIDRIALVSNLNTNNVKELKMIRTPNSSIENIKQVSYQDNKYLTIDKRNNAEFSFLNNKTPGKDLFYFLKIKGRYDKSKNDITDNFTKNSNAEAEFKLHENYPNPFNPTTNIKFEIPEDGHVKLSVFDITGRLIKTLVNEFRNAGTHKVVFDGSEFSSGLYFYKLESGNKKELNRMILIK